MAPSDLPKAQPGQRIRLNGWSSRHGARAPARSPTFSVTDGATAVQVRYEGNFDLFREAEKRFAKAAGSQAKRSKLTALLAKHDENAICRAESLKL